METKTNPEIVEESLVDDAEAVVEGKRFNGRRSASGNHR